MSTVTVEISVSTVHRGPTGGAVFTGQDQNDKWLRVVASGSRIFRPPQRGEVWRVTGHFAKHHKYGDQLYVEQATLTRPTGRSIIHHLLSHPAFRGLGLGQAKASRLYLKFGDDLATLLDEGDVTRLSEVVSEETARKLVASWRQNSQESAVIAFLHRHGVGTRLAGKILLFWPENTIEKLQENPYRLLILTSWDTADHLALSLGLRPADERRLVGAVEAAVYSRLDNEKDTLITEHDLKNKVRRLLRCSNEDALNIAVEAAVRDGTIVTNESGGYQPFGCVVMERFLERRFQELINSTDANQPSLFTNETVELAVREFEQQNNITMNSEQHDAVRLVAAEPLCLILGGAGVGKTTVLKAIRHTIELMGRTVVQVALAGRAAQRMREATGRDAYTIIGLLNQLRSGKIKLGDGDLVVVDESSMVDLILMYRLVRAVPKSTRMLLVGDHHQLPPIGPGLIFHKMVASAAVPAKNLVHVHRQSKSTGIPDIAAQVRDGAVPDLRPFSGQREGVSFYDCAAGFIPARLMEIVGDLGGCSRVQILGSVKGRHPASVDRINDLFHRKLASNKPTLRSWGLSESEPIIYTVNDYEKELFNGSLGMIEKIYAGSAGEVIEENDPVRLLCDFDGRKLRLSESELGNVELAYAITVHKAQGSQFERVIIPIFDNRLLDRTLIYTALTRAVRQVVFVGDIRAFSAAILRAPCVTLRNAGFKIDESVRPLPSSNKL